MKIFVFGSNLAGQHLGGAARFAVLHHGAIMGQPIGRQGDSYALPTMSAEFEPLAFLQIRQHASDFCDYARVHPELQFELTKVGCGIAGYRENQIAPLFADAPSNVERPEGW